MKKRDKSKLFPKQKEIKVYRFNIGKWNWKFKNTVFSLVINKKEMKVEHVEF